MFVDTGQHWDDEMAGAFFRDLGLARPDHSLGAGGGGHAEQTAAMLTGLEPILLEARPDAVLVYGDTNSTLAGALAAAKLDIPVAHVEAGLRSFDRRMPEEINRVVADHLSTWLFAPTPTALDNLAAEGLTEGVALVGDLMRDLASRVLEEVRDLSVLTLIGEALAAAGTPAPLAPGGYLFATIHRQENREPAAIERWSALLRQVATPARPVVLALHPGTRVAVDQVGSIAELLGGAVVVIAPQGYRTSLALQLHAAAVITDSGGVQREAAWLGVPCVILRPVTEWTELLDPARGGVWAVGLDAARAIEIIDRAAPPATSEDVARQRSEAVRIEPAGAAAAIVDALGAAAT